MTCKTAIEVSKRVALTLTLVFLLAAPSFAKDVYLVAEAFTKTLPDSTTVPMYGYYESDASFTVVGTPTSPGPRITVPPGDATLNIHLKNNLSVPTSLVIPGQAAPMTPVRDGGRIKSLTTETAAGATHTYSWTSFKAGTYMYESGTNLPVQIPMGLYGAATKDYAAMEAYPGHPYDQEVVLFYSELDTSLNAAVDGGTIGTPTYPTTIGYTPDYGLVNGKPFETTDPPTLAGYLNDKVLIRFLNAGSKAHVPVIHNTHVDVIAEDGNPYPFARNQYSILMQPGKTKDAIWSLNPIPTGIYPIIDRTGLLTDAGKPGGGIVTCLEVQAVPPTPTTVWVSVNSSSDDAEEKASGSMSLSSSDLEMVYDKSQQKIGMRFNGVNVPKDATIVEAHVQFTVDESATGSTSLTVKGQLHPNPGTFTSTNGDISGRTPTSASQTYSPAGWPNVGDAGTDQQTPNIKNVIQELVNQGSWVSGNSMVILVTGTTTNKSDSRIAESYDGSVGSAPMLHITYANGGGGGSTTTTGATSTTTTSTTTSTTSTTSGGGGFSATIDADVSCLEKDPDTNFGSDGRLQADKSSPKFSLLKVTVGGWNNPSTLNLKLTVDNGSDTGGRIRSVACPPAWTESTATYNNSVGLLVSATQQEKGPVSTGDVVTFDLKPWITGNGMWCFAIDSNSKDGVRYHSTEASTSAANLPQIVWTP